MNVVRAYPPNYLKIVQVVGRPSSNAVYAWGETIYAPHARLPLDPSIISHEEIHRLQQANVGGPEPWWARWLADPGFRFRQEAGGCRAQYLAAAPRLNSQERRRLLRALAGQLSGPMYGRVASRAAAFEALLN